eukprot:7245304-Karenia_brevis.AAC.1
MSLCYWCDNYLCVVCKPHHQHYLVDRQEMLYEPKKPFNESGSSSSECDLEVWPVLHDDLPTPR